MFELEKTKVKLSNVNIHAENHGKEKEPACSLKFEAACPSEILIHFHSELRSLLFKAPDQPDLVEQADPEIPTALRLPKLKALGWEWEGVGYTVLIDYGIGGPSDIELGECKVKDFKFMPQNGGTVLVGFKVNCHPEPSDVGKLYEMIQREIEITVTPPEPTTVGELFKDAA